MIDSTAVIDMIVLALLVGIRMVVLGFVLRLVERNTAQRGPFRVAIVTILTVCLITYANSKLSGKVGALALVPVAGLTVLLVRAMFQVNRSHAVALGISFMLFSAGLSRGTDVVRTHILGGRKSFADAVASADEELKVVRGRDPNRRDESLSPVTAVGKALLSGRIRKGGVKAFSAELRREIERQAAERASATNIVTSEGSETNEPMPVRVETEKKIALSDVTIGIAIPGRRASASTMPDAHSLSEQSRMPASAGAGEVEKLLVESPGWVSSVSKLEATGVLTGSSDRGVLLFSGHVVLVGDEFPVDVGGNLHIWKLDEVSRDKAWWRPLRTEEEVVQKEAEP